RRFGAGSNRLVVSPRCFRGIGEKQRLSARILGDSFALSEKRTEYRGYLPRYATQARSSRAQPLIQVFGWLSRIEDFLEQFPLLKEAVLIGMPLIGPV